MSPARPAGSVAALAATSSRHQNSSRAGSRGTASPTDAAVAPTTQRRGTEPSASGGDPANGPPRPEGACRASGKARPRGGGPPTRIGRQRPKITLRMVAMQPDRFDMLWMLGWLIVLGLAAGAIARIAAALP